MAAPFTVTIDMVTLHQSPDQLDKSQHTEQQTTHTDQSQQMHPDQLLVRTVTLRERDSMEQIRLPVRRLGIRVTPPSSVRQGLGLLHRALSDWD